MFQGRSVPVELGTIGEIIDGKYVEIRKEPRKKKRTNIDIKDFGETALCSAASGDLLQELANTFDIETAKRLFVIALLRTTDPDIRSRDIQLVILFESVRQVHPGVFGCAVPVLGHSPMSPPHHRRGAATGLALLLIIRLSAEDHQRLLGIGWERQ